MEIKVNSSYAIEGGFLIPRSHFSEGFKGERYAIIELLMLKAGGRYVKKHTTASGVEIKKLLGMSKKERLDII